MRNFFIIILLLATPIIAHAKGEIEVKRVTAVKDGDSITIITGNNKTVEIRLFAIDAPEAGQPYNKASKKYLSKLLKSGKVSYTVTDTDRYKRKVADVYVDDKHVNYLMIKNGMAWHYEYYKRSEDYRNAQRYAKANKLGLWAEKNPTTPWDYRRYEKGKQGRNEPMIDSPIKDFYICLNLKSFKFNISNKICPINDIIVVGE